MTRAIPLWLVIRRLPERSVPPHAWRDVRGLALVKRSPTRPPTVALQLRTGALRRVDALHALGSVEQKGLAMSLKREGITRT
jgi:hypothetical protein